jgi:hypothetical protein
MDDGLNPSKPQLRIYDGGDDTRSHRQDTTSESSAQPGPGAAQSPAPSASEQTSQLKHPRGSAQEPRTLLLDEIARKFISSINFSDKVTRAVAPDNANLAQVVDALNARWAKLTGRPHLLAKQVLAELLMLSPVHLQRASGSHLVFEAALSHQSTENRTLQEQTRALKTERLGVASPAATAVVMAAMIIKAYESNKGRFVDHLTLNAFRTQAVDPTNGHSLDHHKVVVKYHFKDGIVADTKEVKERSHNLWCAGSTETFKPRTGLRGWLFGP